jgi:DnaJ-class molecular chaperone
MDYYQILGVKRNATIGEIKKAYRILAKKYHPDSNRNSQDVRKKFHEIHEAYRVLSNKESRRKYDTWGHATYVKYAGSKAYSYTDYAEGEDGHCGACEEHRKHREEDEPAPHSIRAAVYVNYQEILYGAEKTAEIHLEDGVHSVQVKIPPHTYQGCFFPLDEVLCGEKKEELPDNIVVMILVRDTPGYTRHNYHLYSERAVDYADMVLGGEIELTTIEGTQKYILSPGTRNGTRIRLEGRGLWMPPKVGNRGDQYITLRVEIPEALTEKQQRALENFRKLMREGA